MRMITLSACILTSITVLPLRGQIPLRAAPLDRTLAARPAGLDTKTIASALSESEVSAGLARYSGTLLGARGLDFRGSALLLGRNGLDSVALWSIMGAGYRAGFAAANPTTSSRSLLSASWEQAVVQGLTSVIVSNAKASALASASDVLRQGLCREDPTQTLKPKNLLESTCAMALTSNSSTIPVAWTTYKAAFEQDIGRLPDRLLEQLVPKPQAEFRQTLLTGVSLVRQIERGEDPVLMLGSLAKFVAEGATTAKPCQAADRLCVGVRSIGTAVSVLEPLLNTSDPRETVEQLMDERYLAEVLAKYQMGIRRMDIHSGWTPSDVERARLQLAFQRLAFLLAEVQTFGEAAEDRGDGDGDNPAEQEKQDARKFNRYVDATVRLFGLLPEFLPQDQYIGSREMRIALHVADRANVAIAHVRNREYANAFVVVNQIVTTDSLRSYFGNVALPTWYTRYAPFVAEIASAQTPESFQSALSAAVAPLGSYRTKRERRVYFGLNAYVGIQGGLEELRDVDVPESTEDLNSGQFGLAVPVGVEFGFGTGSFSFGLFGSLLDVGNVARFRIDDEPEDDSVEVKDEPEYGFAQLFSPGLYLTVGLGKRLPATIGFGRSWTPALREVKDAAGSSQSADAWRWGLFVGIDVPLHTF